MATRKTQKSQPKKAVRAVSKDQFEAKKAAEAMSNGIPSAEQIRVRAYELFQARGGRHGNDWSDWFEAEQQLVRHSPSMTG